MATIWTPDEEAERLEARFKAAKKAGISQREFADTHKVPGGASMISQHVKKHRPIALDAALAYAKGFGVPLEEISPRLAAEGLKASSATADAGFAPATSQEPDTIDKLMAVSGLDIEVLLQLLRDLGDIPSPQLSGMLKDIHEKAEMSRAAAAHFAKRGKLPEMAANVGGTSAKSIKIHKGDGNPDQGELPLIVVDDPLSALPGPRETAWYRHVEGLKKPHGI